MESNERVFRHAFGKLALMFVGVLFFGFVAFTTGKIDYILIAVTGIALVIVLLYATSRVRISDEEIATSRLLGSKSLRWTDIGRVSTRGQALRLHNHDEDLILSIDSQLEGYAEILDLIFKKRPDLFDAGENDILSRGILGSVFALGIGLFIIAISIPIFIYQNSEWLFGLIFVGLGLYLIVAWALSPQSIILENQTLRILYLFKEVSYKTDEIGSITLQRQRTKNGYLYFVQVNLKPGKPLKLPTFKQGSALTYQILKRWHEKATSNEPIYLE